MLSRIKARAHVACANLLSSSGLLARTKYRAATRGEIVVLTFHRVLPDEEFGVSSSLPGIIVRQSTFARFVAWAARNFEIVDLGKGEPDWSAQTSRPRIALTFDDGWLDNYHFASEPAADNGASITIFACPGLTDTPFPFWPEKVRVYLAAIADRTSLAHACPELSANDQWSASSEDIVEHLKTYSEDIREDIIRRIAKAAGDSDLPLDREPLNRTMTWQQILDLHARHVNFGSHTFTHPILTNMPGEAVAAELKRSRDCLEKALDSPCRIFAYPNGSKNPEIREKVREAGYQRAFTTEPGLWSRNTDPLLIPRVNMWENKLTGLDGEFSPVMAEYCMYWRTRRA